jgi:hypothetical protein
MKSSVVCIPPNPDNQIESTVVQENIKLPRMSHFLDDSYTSANVGWVELTRVISHAAQNI